MTARSHGGLLGCSVGAQVGGPGWESGGVVGDGALAGRGRGLSRERIVTEAILLIDEQGISMASMRNLGQRLGVRAMSLYRYVKDRETLFDAVVERIVHELDDDPDVPQNASDGWRSYLDGLARGVRRYARAHPHAFPLVATRPPAAPWVNPPLRSLRWIEAMLRALHDEGRPMSRRCSPTAASTASCSASCCSRPAR